MTLSRAMRTRHVIASSGKPLPTPAAATGRFVPISSGVATKADRLSAGLAAVSGRGPASGAANSGGSRSARTTPQGPPSSSSPTKDIRPTRVRSKSNTGDEYESTTTTRATAGARASRAGAGDVTRRGVVGDDATRRHRTRNDVTADSAARQPGSRTRQGSAPPASTPTKLRSTSQKRAGEIGGVARQQPASRTTQDTTRSPYRSVLFQLTTKARTKRGNSRK